MNFLNKIVTLPELQKIVKKKKENGLQVALCHGTFDLLHPGHLRHFQEAHRMSDFLIVTITPDRFVIKGENRPVYNQELRAEYIASLEYVDFVAINDAPDAIHLICFLSPSFYVKGNDYRDFTKDPTGKISLEVDSITNVGGKMYYTNDIRFSSTELIKTFYKDPK